MMPLRKLSNFVSILAGFVMAMAIMPRHAQAQSSCQSLFQPDLSLAAIEAIERRFAPRHDKEVRYSFDRRDRVLDGSYRGTDGSRAATEAIDAQAVFPPYLIISAGRALHSFTNSLLDADEITQRQDAIREIQAGLGDELQTIFLSDESKKWREIYYTEYGGEESFGARHVVLRPTPMTNAVFLREPKLFSDRYSREEMQNKLEQRPKMFSEMRLLDEKLKDAKSLRLRQLRWVLSSVSRREHRYQLVSWIEKFSAAKTLKAQHSLILQAMSGSMWDRLQTLEEVYGELAMYFDLAKHAEKNGWHTYPKFLNPEQAGPGPILRIVDGHPPRYYRENPETSVPNSIDVNLEKGRSLIVTGPNGQGKSTYTRMVAQLVLLAQTGSPVPAVSMELTPLSIIPYVRPRDNPGQKESLFMVEAKALWKDVYLKAQANPYSLILLDELIPSTTAEIREDTETVFLQLIAKTGAIAIASTHNFGTTNLAYDSQRDFRNFHVSKYKLLPGRLEDEGVMYVEAAARLREMGWSEEAVHAVLELGKKRKSR